MENIESLAVQIQEVHRYFKNQAIKQVNNALTIRNWMVGYYIVIYEQEGNDRAAYGEKTLRFVSESLSKKGVRGFSDRNLRLCRQFLLAYPGIWQSVTAKFQIADNQFFTIWQSSTAKFPNVVRKPDQDVPALPVDTLLDKLTFTHFIELIKIDNPLERSFYEIQTIKNNWTVSQLQREINTLLYERIGLSTDKAALIEKLKTDSVSRVADIIKSPFLLEFLGIPEKAAFSETDLEQAIINHLQQFLIEMGRGFCFEARQKRISFGNRHYRIDLVFYHRILKCHILIDLKLGEFDHADAGQMNVYLNYYKENEMTEYDNPPVGIILCKQKDNALVHFATGGLPMEVFVSKYKLQLPSEAELRELVESEMKYFTQK